MHLRSFTRVCATSLLTTLVAASAGAQVLDGSFEQHQVGSTNQYQYSRFQAGPPTTPAARFSSPWFFGASTGLINGTGSAFNTLGSIPDGSQVAFFQGKGSFIEQAIRGLTPGRYTLSFYTAGRQNSGCCDGNTSFNVTYRGTVIGSSTTSSFDQWTLNTFTFNALAGPGELRFVNTSTSGDHTFFLDAVSIGSITSQATTAPEPATIALVGSGLVTLLVMRRRRA